MAIIHFIPRDKIQFEIRLRTYVYDNLSKPYSKKL